MSFSVTLKDASFFKKIINAMSVLDEPIIRIEEDRLYVRQLAEIGSAMIHFELPASTFDQYECTKPDIIKISRAELLRCMRRAKAEQYIGLAIEEGKEDRLAVTLSEKSIKEFRIPILDVPSDERTPPPEVTKARFDDVKIKMDTSSIADSVDEFKSVLHKDFGRLDFTATEGNLLLNGEGATRSLSVTHMLGTDILAMEVVEDKILSAYSISTLNAMIEGASALSGVVIIEFAEYKPIRLTYELPFEGKLQYYLAPMLKLEGDK